MDSRTTKVLFYPLNWPALLAEIPDDDNHYKMVVLDNRELTVALSAINILTRCPWAWGVKKDDPVWGDILAFRDGLEAALMAVLSIDDLIKTNLMLVAAMTGQTIDRDHPEDYLTGEYDPDGLTPATASIASTVAALDEHTGERLGDINAAVEDVRSTLSDTIDKLEEIRQAIVAQAGGDPESLADDLEGIASTISTVATILGAL